MAWLVEKRVIYVQLAGVVSNDDIRYSQAQGVKILDQTEEQFVHWIFDMRNVTKPASIAAMTKIETAQHPKVGYGITIGISNPAFKFIASVSAQIVQMRSRFLDDLPAAEAFLKKLYPDLPEFTAIEDVEWFYQYP